MGMESLNLTDLDVEDLEQRLELGHLSPNILHTMSCTGNTCDGFSGSCTSNGCVGYASCGALGITD